VSIAALSTALPMSHDRPIRLPISTRHAFALAFDLAARRDALHSLVVPLLLRSPWILALALLPPIADSDQPMQVMLLTIAALLGDFIMLLVIGAMLRFRARSVFNTPLEVRPAPVVECYAQGLKRVPWLFVTEVVRNASLVFATFFFVLPAIFLGFRLAFATEAIVLSEPHTAGSFQKSFQITEGRFERWLEMIVVSVIMVFAIIFLGAAMSIVAPRIALNSWVAVTRLLITAITPIIQYAWTFFYLRLIEADSPGVEVGPAYATALGVAAGADAAQTGAWAPAETSPSTAESQPATAEESELVSASPTPVGTWKAASTSPEDQAVADSEREPQTNGESQHV